ncbi:hypothetical protein GS399_05285 [Pedobacter sp. HMF7647]|uniref:Peptidase S74 domain-containing protein n=1 Tax=Hufsiella arboris TaxID=2695275 RepID=A0A7K1Y8K7_9SPHI|nr:hypothetical protein [Hufsiella arboris]MXV50378.1 hypothetical protein [Hufsiella arboris]
MQKLILLLLACFFCNCLLAQTNWFPPSGAVGIGTTTPANNSLLQLSGGGLAIGEHSGNSDASLHISRSYGGFDRLTQFHPVGPSKPGLNLLGYSDPTGTVGWWSWGALANSGTWAFQPTSSFGGNTGLFITRSGNLGLATQAPGSKFTIRGISSGLSFEPGDGHDYFGTISFNREAVGGAIFDPNGSAFQINNGGTDKNLHFQVYNGVGAQIDPDALVISGVNGNVGIGERNPLNKLDVKGTIHSQVVRVDMTGWSDDVFAEDYERRKLADVERYIHENGHLPEIPSEAEVKDKGIDLGDMNARLLKKIEELTLYVIELEKDLSRLKNSVNEKK